MENVLIIGITLSLFLGLLIFSKKEISAGDRLFGIWQLVLLVHFVLLYFRYSGWQWQYPHLLGLDTSINFLHAPILYLYFRTMTHADKVKWKVLILHLMPFILINILLASTFYFLSAGQKTQIYREALNQMNSGVYLNWIDTLIRIQTIVYIYLSYQLVTQYEAAAKGQLSSLRKINLNWLWKLMYGLMVLYGFNLILFVVQTFFNLFSVDAYGLISISNVCLLLAFLGFNGIRNTFIFSNPLDAIRKPEVPVEKYKKSGLNQTASERIRQKLTAYMEEEKPYLNSDLSLDQLATNLNISYNHLSQDINQDIGLNFYDFINEYRVKDAMKGLVDPERNHFKIMAIAYDSGFNSKSVFYDFFKKVAGTTPSDFRQNNSPK